MNKLKVYLQLARPHQYLKNGFIWLPLLFGYGLSNPKAILLTGLAFVAFCLLASAIYIINDLRDIEEDRNHPIKKMRPLASGAVRPSEAGWLTLGLFIGAISISIIFLHMSVVYILMTYFLLNIAYTFMIKRIPIFDIVCIAMGFVLRIYVGCTAPQIQISPWIVIVTFLLALFLALAKRRDDLLLLNKGHRVRKAIDGYSLEFISLAMGIMASVIIVAYILYTVSPEVMAKHGTHLYVSAIWVLLGILRYLQITFVEEKSGSPTLVLIRDRLLQGIVAAWLVNIYILLYW